MRKPYLLMNAMLWAVAILAAAVLKAPPFFSVILLPMLATLSQRTVGSRVCRQRSERS